MEERANLRPSRARGKGPLPLQAALWCLLWYPKPLHGGRGPILKQSPNSSRVGKEGSKHLRNTCLRLGLVWLGLSPVHPAVCLPVSGIHPAGALL